jgi:hypothetical protein
MCNTISVLGDDYMGRNNYPNHGPRTSLVADREIRQAMRGNSPAAFGIKRMLDFDSSEAVTEATFSKHVLEGGDVLPLKVELRDPLSVTLLSQKVIGRQLSRGRMAGFNLGKTRALLEKDQDCAGRTDQLKVDIGDIKVYRGRIIYAELLSEQLEEEVVAIGGVLETLGLKGTSRHDMRVPHLTLGETTKGQMLRVDEQDRIIDELHAVMPVSAVVEPWFTYPYDVFDTSAAA